MDTKIIMNIKDYLNLSNDDYVLMYNPTEYKDLDNSALILSKKGIYGVVTEQLDIQSICEDFEDLYYYIRIRLKNTCFKDININKPTLENNFNFIKINEKVYIYQYFSCDMKNHDKIIDVLMCRYDFQSGRKMDDILLPLIYNDYNNRFLNFEIKKENIIYLNYDAEYICEFIGRYLYNNKENIILYDSEAEVEFGYSPFANTIFKNIVDVFNKMKLPLHTWRDYLHKYYISDYINDVQNPYELHHIRGHHDTCGICELSKEDYGLLFKQQLPENKLIKYNMLIITNKDYCEMTPEKQWLFKNIFEYIIVT